MLVTWYDTFTHSLFHILHLSLCSSILIKFHIPTFFAITGINSPRTLHFLLKTIGPVIIWNWILLYRDCGWFCLWWPKAISFPITHGDSYQRNYMQNLCQRMSLASFKFNLNSTLRMQWNESILLLLYSFKVFSENCGRQNTWDQLHDLTDKMQFFFSLTRDLTNTQQAIQGEKNLFLSRGNCVVWSYNFHLQNTSYNPIWLITIISSVDLWKIVSGSVANKRGVPPAQNMTNNDNL